MFRKFLIGLPISMEKFVLEQHARKNEQRRNNYITKYVHLTDIQKNLNADGFFEKKDLLAFL